MAKRAPSNWSGKKDSKAKPSGLPLGPDSRVVLLKGPELFIRQQHTSGLRDALAERFGGVETFQFDGERDEAADILDECRSFGLMGGHKLVIVDNADSFVKEANRPLVERYVQAPSDEATLVMRADKWNKGKLDAMIEKVGSIVPCETPDDETAVKWIIVLTKRRLGVSLEERAARMLVHRFGPDLGRLSSEAGKLAVAAGEGGVITEAIVADLCAGSREIEPWAVQQPLLTGNPAHAISALRRIAEATPRDTHVVLAMASAQLAANLHALAAGAGSGLRPEVIGKPRGMWSNRLFPVADAARGVDPAAARDLLRAALDVDAKGKSGVGDAEVNLEALAVQFAQTLAGPSKPRR